MRERDTTVKWELVTLNEELTNMHYDLLAQLDSSDQDDTDDLQDALYDLGENVKSGAHELVGGMIASVFIGGIFGLRAAAVNARASDPTLIWLRKLEFCIITICSFDVRDESLPFAEMREQLLFNGMSKHDSEYALLACINKGLIRKIEVDDEELLEPDYCNIVRFCKAIDPSSYPDEVLTCDEEELRQRWTEGFKAQYPSLFPDSEE